MTKNVIVRSSQLGQKFKITGTSAAKPELSASSPLDTEGPLQTLTITLKAPAQPGPYNAEKWIGPAPAPGDVVLFPSYLMHAVPPNAGGRRISLAFNAIPARLESWGYAIRFSG